MKWTYKEFVNDEPDQLIEPMRNFLNGLPTHVGATAKVVTSNQHDGEARGVIFYDQSGSVTAPPPFPTAAYWEIVQCQSGDYSTLYNAAANTLNESFTTPENHISRAVYSSFSYCNGHTDEPVMGITYYDGVK